MRKICIFTLLLMLPLALFAGAKSQVLYRAPGDIASACINESGLIIARETSAELVDLQPLGLAVIKGGIPSPAPDQRLVFSDEGRYALLVTYAGSGDYYEIPEFTIVNVKASGPVGRQTWPNLQDIKVSGVPGLSEVFVSGRGNVVGVKRNINIAEQSELLFYSPQGKLLNTLPFPAVTQVKFNDDGRLVGAISGIRGLVLFTSEGKEIVELGPCQWFDLTYLPIGGDIPGAPIAVKCAYTNGNTIGVYSQASPDVRWEKQFGDEVFRDVSISWYNADILAVSKHNLYHIDGATGKIIWEKHLASPQSFTTCALYKNSPSYNYIAFGWEIDKGREVPSDQRHTQGGFTLIKNPNEPDFSEYSENLTYSTWNVFTPEMKFYRQGLLIQTMDEIRWLKSEER